MVAVLHHHHGLLAHFRGDFSNARRWLERSEAELRVEGNEFHLAMALNRLGLLALERGDLQAAHAYMARPQACSRCHHLDVARIVSAAAGYVARTCMMRICVMRISIMQKRAIGGPRHTQLEPRNPRRRLTAVDSPTATIGGAWRISRFERSLEDGRAGRFRRS